MRASVSSHRLSNGPLGGHLPQPYSAVVARGGEHRTIGAESYTEHCTAVPERLSNRSPGGHVPKPNRLVAARRSDRFAIWTKAYAGYFLAVAGSWLSEWSPS